MGGGGALKCSSDVRGRVGKARKAMLSVDELAERVKELNAGLMQEFSVNGRSKKYKQLMMEKARLHRGQWRDRAARKFVGDNQAERAEFRFRSLIASGEA